MERDIDLTIPKDLVHNRRNNRRKIITIGGGLIGCLAISALGLSSDQIRQNLEIGVNNAMLYVDTQNCMSKHGRYSEPAMYAQDILRVSRGGEPEHFRTIEDVEGATQLPFYKETCPKVAMSYWAVQDARKR